MKNRKERKQIQKNAKETVTTDITELLPFKQYKNDCFELKNGKFIDFVKIICHDLISASDDQLKEFESLTDRFYKTYGEDFKIIASNYPTDTESQQKFYNHKIDTTKNAVFRELLQNRLSEEKYIAQSLTDREYYFMFIFNSIEERNETLAVVLRNLGEHYLVDKLSRDKKEKIIFKLCNKNLSIKVDDEVIIPTQDIINTYVDEVGFDPFLLSRIQPQGGITFNDERFIKTGTGYEVCLHVYKYARHIDFHWLALLLNINNVIATVDVSTEDTDVVKRNLNRSMSEQQSRINSAKSYREALSSETQLNEFKRLYMEIEELDEVVKLITIRLFISGTTKEEVDKTTAAVIKRFAGKGFRAAVFLDENKAEWLSMFQTYSEQQNTPYKRAGQPVTAHDLAAGDPFNFSSLNDPLGTYIGTTRNCNGIVNFDFFQVDEYRTFYNALISGKMGSGKSTLTKKLFEIQAALGNFIRCFDVKDEYTNLVESLGGKICYLDGSAGMINILDIMKSSDAGDNINYTRHLSKLRSIYKFLAPDSDAREATEFESVLREFYESVGLTPQDGREITGLPSAAYPTLSELLNFIDKKIDKFKQSSGNTAGEKVELIHIEKLVNVQATIRDLVLNYGSIFDGHSSIANIYGEQIVCFNVKNLANLKEEIFNAQVFNAISMCWDNCIKIGQQMKNSYDRKQIDWRDIIRFLIIVDEAHHFITPRNIPAVEQFSLYMREGRAYFGGLLFVSQNVSDFIPEGTDQEGANAIRKLFENTQYKFIMRQDESALSHLKNIFKASLTESQFASIPKLKKGDCILAISGDKTIDMHIDVSATELELFAGGA